VKVDPGLAGFDAGRLARIEEHLRTRYVEPGKIAGCQVLVFRRGHVALSSSIGSMDLERSKRVYDDTIWRLYSMTKPITGVALLSLYERGLFELSDPVHRFLPEWRDVMVKERAGAGAAIVTGDGREGEANAHATIGTASLVPPTRPMSVRDVMMHMGGIGYGPRSARLDLASITASSSPAARLGPDMTLEKLSQLLAAEPLRSQPGTRWLYAWSTDICARLVEVVSGQPFDEYLRATIFDPLGMADTGFSVPDSKIDRFAACYTRNAEKRLVLVDDPLESRYRKPPTLLSGGGGLVATTADYLRFCRMLLNGGELDGARVLSRKTVELMSANHLPGGGQLRDFAHPGGYGEVGFDGSGFGLTVAVGLGPTLTQSVGSVGEYMWGGLASTIFWIDPAEAMIVIFMTQLIPSATFNFRGQLHALTHGAIND
jgi:CubicO group peptidase (beta-lactamase class C family)